MKKLLLTLVLGMMSTTPSFAAAEGFIRMVTVDMLVLMKNHPDAERNEKFMETKSKDLDKKVEAIKKEGEALQAEGKRLMEQFRNPMLNDKAKADIEKQLQDLQQKLIAIEQRYRSEMMRGSQELQEDRNRMLKNTMDDVRQHIAKYGSEKGFDYILDSNSVPYSKPVYDVTDDILKLMGVDPAKAKGKESDEGK